MLRCLNCQQSKEFRFGGHVGEQETTITFDDTNTKIIIMVENDTNTKHSEEVCGALHKALSEQKDGEVVCNKCDEPLSLMDAKNAFQHPGQFFDAENLCHCGGELWMDQVPNTKVFAFVCEKCDWVKPRAGVSGA